MTLQTLTGKTVIIIGGSSGMGLATAKMALEQGVRVTIASRSTAKLTAVQTAHPDIKTAVCDITRPNETKANRVVGEVEGRHCVLVDDMIDTGGTIVQAAEACMAAGAKGVIIVSTHAVFSGPAVERLKDSVAEEVIVTNTLPLREDQTFDKLTVLSIAPLLARAVHEVFEDGSVTSLFENVDL